MKQQSFAVPGQCSGFECFGRTTHTAEFHARMDTLVPCRAFCGLIEALYPKASKGRRPVGLGRMLRMYFIANGFNLVYEACEDALYDVPMFRAFCRFDLG